MTCQSRFSALYFPCSVGTQSDFEAANQETLPSGWFTTLNSKRYLKAPVPPNKYAPVLEEVGDRLKYVSTLAGSYAPVISAHPVFRVTIGVADLRFRHLLEFIAERCTGSNLANHTPIEILDFVRPDKNRRVNEGRRLWTSQGIPYTPRLGRIVNFEEEEGAIRSRDGILHTSKGFTIVFQELDKRRVLG